MSDPHEISDDDLTTANAVKPVRKLAFNAAAAPTKTVFRAIRENLPADELRHYLKAAPLDGRDSDGLTYLHAAVAERNMTALAILINAGCDLHAKIDGITPLMLCFAGQRMQDAALLLAKADPHLSQHTLTGITPAHCAAEMYGYDRVLEALLEHGIDPAAKDDKGRPPLYYALKKKYDTAFLLCNAGGCLPEDMPVLREAIATQEKTYGYDYDWNLLLDFAAKKDPVELRKALGVMKPQMPAELGKDAAEIFNAVRSHGGSSFRFEKYYTEATGLDLQDQDGMTPLMAAIENETGSDMWAVRPLSRHSPADARDHAGRTALHYAVMHTDNPAASIIDDLIGHGVDVDAQDNFGRTALMRTMRGGNHMHTLMEAGADPFIKDNLGLTAMDYGKLYKSDYCQELLAEQIKEHDWHEDEPKYKPYRYTRHDFP
ncbi:MAG: ankyrin repeat domain-containing protein [Alphaproteobacteria bacterium]